MSTPLASDDEVPGIAPGEAAPRSRSLLWGTGWYAGYQAVSLLLRVGRGLVIPRLLAPAQYGLWSSLGVVTGYSMYADLGVQQQLAKRLPLALGREGLAGYWRLAQRGASWAACITLLLAAALFGASFWIGGAHADFYRPALRLLSGVLLAQNVRYFVLVLLNARQEFGSLSINSSLTDLLGFVVGIAGLLSMGVLGLVWGLLVAEVGGAVHALVHLRRLGIPPVRFTLVGVGRLIREGLLLLSVGLVELVMMTVDQLFLLRFFSKHDYGLYAFGLFMVLALLTACSVLMVAHPRILQLWAGGERRRSQELIEASVSAYVLLCALCAPLFVLLVDVVVRWYLPAYAEGMPVYALMPLLALARGPVILLRAHFFVHDRERRLIAFEACGLGLTVLIDVLVVALGGGLAHVALASGAGYLLTGLLMFRDYERALEVPTRWAKYALLGSSCALVLLVAGFYGWRPASGDLRYLLGSAAAGAVVLAVVTAIVHATRRSWAEVGRHYLEGSRVRVPAAVRRWLVG